MLWVGGGLVRGGCACVWIYQDCMFASCTAHQRSSNHTLGSLQLNSGSDILSDHQEAISASLLALPSRSDQATQQDRSIIDRSPPHLAAAA